MKTLLLGLGNPYLSDDAVGLRLAAALRGPLAVYPDLDVVEDCSVGGLDLLDVLCGYQRVIVLDSLRARDGVPGDWHHFTAEALRETAHLAGVHDANFATVLALGRRLGLPLPEPRNIHVFAVEMADGLTFSERMSPRLERKFPAFSAAILDRVRALLDHPEVACAGRHIRTPASLPAT
ncbi:MAG TPA: hydrogenase maturation protease [Vicinamibacteria bacterium]|nr:hydrogenase maturation protease [Vicinamibacteria bacterium]